LTLSDWLEAHGVTQVTMEATGVYWAESIGPRNAGLLT
jgi:hypothetical protein